MPKIEIIRTLPSVEYLRELFEYSYETGELRWKRRPREHFAHDQSYGRWNTLFAGKPAGHFDKGYGRISIDAIDYKAHRIVWKLVYGEEPPEMIDHRDGNPSNNRLNNIRVTTYDGQAWNRKMKRNNISGYQGVSRDRGRWKARLGRDYLGMFSSAKEASKV